jgi:hypothetical protein
MDKIGVTLGVYNNQRVIRLASTNYSYVKTPENRE